MLKLQVCCHKKFGATTHDRYSISLVSLSLYYLSHFSWPLELRCAYVRGNRNYHLSSLYWCVIARTTEVPSWIEQKLLLRIHWWLIESHSHFIGIHIWCKSGRNYFQISRKYFFSPFAFSLWSRNRIYPLTTIWLRI